MLGVELAGSLTQSGLNVDLIISEDRPWARFAGEASGRSVSLFLEQHGVTLYPGRRVLRLEGDGRVQRVVLASGESLVCDFAVASVGMQVNKEILSGTPIAAEKAILVDEYCRTSFQNIWAAGDCAAVFDPLFGKHRVLEHWEGASITGRIAGTNMAGGHEAYDAVSFFDSEVFGLKLGVWGEAKLVDRRIIRGNPSAEAPNFVEFGIAPQGRIVQVVAIGQPDGLDVLPELVKRRFTVNGNEEKLKIRRFR